ncbi:MAG TPA: hypothetical protein VFN55_04825 [Solirubrobacteraceae bacterium]|nr:hypothetical protein [Solirubrobacteraceae bacterium]
MSTTVGMQEIRLRWIASCRRCGNVLNTGSRAFHDPATHTMVCLACAYAESPSATPSAREPAESAAPARV